MSVHLVYGLFLLQFVLGVSLFHLDYMYFDVRYPVASQIKL